MTKWQDLGLSHRLSFAVWAPDRDLNPRHKGFADIDPVGAIVEHLTPTGEVCRSHVYFDVPGVDRIIPNGAHRWQVERLDPLTLSPSLLCRRCGDHGFVRDGKWAAA